VPVNGKGKAYGIHWPDLDEDNGMEGLLAGKCSGESQASFQKWLQSRAVRLVLQISEFRQAADITDTVIIA
jgi:hypothetical protein